MVTGVRWAIFGGRSVSRARGLFMFVVGAVCTAFFPLLGVRFILGGDRCWVFVRWLFLRGGGAIGAMGYTMPTTCGGTSCGYFDLVYFVYSSTSFTFLPRLPTCSPHDLIHCTEM